MQKTVKNKNIHTLYQIWTLGRNSSRTFTSVGVVGHHVPITVHTRVTATADNKTFTDTSSSDKVVDHISPALTLSTVLWADRVTVARCTHNVSIIICRKPSLLLPCFYYPTANLTTCRAAAHQMYTRTWVTVEADRDLELRRLPQYKCK